MLALVNPEILRDALRELRIGIVPSGIHFDQRDLIWRIAVDLIRTHMNERSLRTMPVCSFEQIQCTACIYVKVIKWARRGQVMARLRSAVHNGRRPYFLDQ